MAKVELKQPVSFRRDRRSDLEGAAGCCSLVDHRGLTVSAGHTAYVNR